jgi:hypothetical protein
MALNAPRSRTIILTDAGTAAFSIALAEYDDTVSNATPTPAPVFTTPASVSSDGTPQVGERLLGIDGVALNTDSYRRRWLLGTTVLATINEYFATGPGQYRFESIATGPGGETTSGSNITVAAATVVPVLGALTLSPTTATAGTSTTITISGATAGSVITGTVPAGMTLNSAARTITGTPTTAGSPSIVLTETLAGATGSPRQSTVGVTIAAAPVTPVLGALAVSPSSATVGTAYSGTINGLTSGSSIALSGAGAAGLSIAGGVITGTPTTAGAVNIVETLAGATGSPRTSSGVITVAAAAVVLNALTLSPTTATVGTAYTGTVSGKTSGSTLALSGTGAAGLTVSGSTVSGTPTTAGSVNIIETLAGATGSPRTSSGVLTVSAASAMTYNTLAAGPGRVPTSFQANTNVGTFPITTRAPAWASGDGAISNLRTGDVGRAWVAFPDSDNAGAYRLKRTLEYPAGVYHDVMWAGVSDVIVPPGVEIALSDVILDSRNGQPLAIPAAAKFYWRTVFLAINSAATGYPRISVPAIPASVGEEHGLVYGQDYSKGGTVPPSAEGWVYEPAFVRGDVAAANARSMYIMSDSKNAEGTSDVVSYGPRGGHGMVQRTCDKLMIPYMINGRATATATNMISSAQKYHAKLFAAVGVSHAHMAMGSNDLSGSTNGFAILQRFESVMATIPAQTVVGVNTLQPGAISTDAFTTLEGQTTETLARRNARLYINQEIRKKTGLTAFLANGYIFDEEDFISTGRNTGLQKLPPNNRILPASATMAASSNELNVVGANFTVADVGTGVFVVGAGASGTDLRTFIQSVVSSEKAILVLSAGTAVTGANCNIGSFSIDGTHAGTQACVLFADFAAPSFPPASAETITLGTLTLSAAIVAGTASTGTIVGATRGSAIASNVTGLTVNGPARTYSWDGTGAVGTVGNGLVEALAGAVGSAKSSPVTVSAT